MRKALGRSRDETTLEIGYVLVRTAGLLVAVAGGYWLARNFRLVPDAVAEPVVRGGALALAVSAVAWGVLTLVRFDRRPPDGPDDEV